MTGARRIPCSLRVKAAPSSLGYKMAKVKRKSPFKVQLYRYVTRMWTTEHSGIKSEGEAQDVAKNIARTKHPRGAVRVLDAEGDTCWDGGYATFMPDQPQGKDKL